MRSFLFFPFCFFFFFGVRLQHGSRFILLQDTSALLFCLQHTKPSVEPSGIFPFLLCLSSSLPHSFSPSLSSFLPLSLAAISLNCSGSSLKLKTVCFKERMGGEKKTGREKETLATRVIDWYSEQRATSSPVTLIHNFGAIVKKINIPQ